jgi:hypothetical protein
VPRQLGGERCLAGGIQWSLQLCEFLLFVLSVPSSSILGTQEDPNSLMGHGEQFWWEIVG